MAETLRSIEKAKLLVGEGPEDERFFSALIGFLRIDDVQIERFGGTGNLSPYLKTLVVRPGFSSLRSLGITRDANGNAADAFRSVCGALLVAHLPVPAAPRQFATEVPGGFPNTDPIRVGTFILPGDNVPGMLEDLCLASVQTAPGVECVDDYLSCIEQAAGRVPDNLAKARVHAWLASRERPGLRLGEAAEKGYWPWESAAFDQIKQFITDL